MQTYTIKLPDGSAIGVDYPMLSLRLTGCVNSKTELAPGSVCAAMLEVTVMDTGLQLPAGTELTLFRGDAQLGIYIAQKPERRAGLWSLTAYDKVSLLDKDLSQWLYGLPSWPYTLQSLSTMVLEQCKLTEANELPLHGDLPVDAFSAEGITGRKLMQWICEVAGCFCRATTEGKLEYAWFTPTDIRVAPTGDVFYYADGFTCADYTTTPVEKVQVQLTSGDLGALYPDIGTETNTMRITGNYLLTTCDAAYLEQVAQGLYHRMQGISYTPSTVITITESGIRAGDIFTVVDTDGKEYSVYAMTVTEENGVLTAEATGSYRRDSTAAVNNARYEALTGKVMNLQIDIEGVKIENAEAQGRIASMALTVEGIDTRVSQQSAEGEAVKSQLTTLSQSATALQLQVEALEKNGTSKVTTSTGYTFDENGLRISKSGQEMENLLDNTGMYVSRSGQVILQANANGVEATDVTVRNYLIIGSHARFEDYPTGRTACFYIA